MTREETAALLAGHEQPAWRADQLLHGIYRDGIARAADLTTFPKALRAALDAEIAVGRLEAVARQSAADSTVKLLLALADGKRVEAVAIPAGERMTACLSSQVGCALDCHFCATAQMGLLRNLRAGEIVAQYLALEAALGGHLAGGAHRITNVVFMGMGEALANFNETLKAVRLLNAPYAVGLRKRAIRISTVGLVPQIDRLAREEPEVGLTISLNAPRDSLRDRLMPVNRAWPIAPLMDAADRFTAETQRMVTFAYVLIPRVNDTPREARELAALLAGRPCKLNLIPHNPHPSLPPLEALGEDGGAGESREEWPAERGGRGARAPGRHPMVAHLAERLPHVTYRRSRGLPIEAACGQLYHERAAARGAEGAD